MKNKRVVFLITFLVGLLIIAFHDTLFIDTIIADISALVLGIIISIFGGAGYIIDIYKS